MNNKQTTKQVIAEQQAINRELWAKENGRLHRVDANKLIAEFMGVKYPMLKGSDLQYHTSWDWLMPVAKKCINPEVNTEGWDNLAVALTTCNLDEVYQAVVEFIKEYNAVEVALAQEKYDNEQ